MKKAAAFVAFFLFFLGVYIYADSVLMLKPDDGKKLMDDYRSLDHDTVDVISIGSSHVGVNIDPELLWTAYGISEVNLWSGMQPMWASYYYAKEALRYQRPKLLVVDMYRCAGSDDYGEYQYSVKSVQALKPGLDKIRASLTSFEDWRTAAEVLWGMPVYHERYDQLTREDFEYIVREKGTLTDAGIHNNQTVYSLTMPDYKLITDEAPLTEKNESFLRKLIKLSKDHQVPLLLVTIPYLADETEAARANTIARIAQEEDVFYLNYLKETDRIGLDGSLDFYDTGHMNQGGVAKFTRAFAQDIQAYAEIPDRRDDPSFTYFSKETGAQVEPDYQLTEQFLGDGVTRFVDTAVRLYENPYASWTVMAQLKPCEAGQEQTFFSCAFEKAGRLHGIVVRQAANGQLEIRWDDDNFTFFEMPLRQDGTFDLALVKAVDTYAVYLNGVLAFDHIVLPAAENDGPLLVGCRASENGEKTDFGAAQVCCLEVYLQTLSPSEIAGWIHDTLPLPYIPLGFDRNQTELLYQLPEQFIGGGTYLQQDHVDTGISLFDDPGTSFTLMARLVPQPIDGENNVYFSCFAEEADRWRGLLLRGESDRSLSLLLGQVYNLNIPCSPDSPLNLCVQKDRNVYTVYVDGKLALDHVTIDCDPYDGTLLVGCEETLEGAMFRKSATRVSALELFSGILPEEDVLAFDYQDAPLPAERTATSVAYQLPQAFLGDGESNAVDTGVRLFDVPEKSWTVDCVLLPNYSSYYDVYISCFNEESFSYSGLLLRQEDQGKITVYMGQLETIQVSYSETEQQLHFVIVKSGSEYAVYVNGQLAGQVDSPCHYYDGSLLIGCEQEADGTFFRYSKVKILTLNVTDEVLDPQVALNLSNQSLQSGRFD